MEIRLNNFKEIAKRVRASPLNPMECEKVFYHDGTPYQVIYGDEAYLQVDDHALQTLLQNCIPTEGRRP